MRNQDQRTRTVVVTGASAGVGRAVAREFARHGWNVGLIARGEAGLQGAIDDVVRAGGRPMAFAADVADADARRPGGRGGRRGLRRHRRVGEQRHGDGLRAGAADLGRGVPARDRGDLSRPGPRYPCGARAHGAARFRHHRPHRLGAGLPLDPAAGDLLRGQGRGARLRRLAAQRASARREQGAADDGAAAGGEHAAIRLGPLGAAAQARAGAADLPARGHRPPRLRGGADRAARIVDRDVGLEGDRRQHGDPGLDRRIPGQTRISRGDDQRACQ